MDAKGPDVPQGKLSTSASEGHLTNRQYLPTWDENGLL